MTQIVIISGNLKSDVECVFQACAWQFYGTEVKICNKDEKFPIAMCVSHSATRLLSAGHKG